MLVCGLHAHLRGGAPLELHDVLRVEVSEPAQHPAHPPHLLGKLVRRPPPRLRRTLGRRRLQLLAARQPREEGLDALRMIRRMIRMIRRMIRMYLLI